MQISFIHSFKYSFVHHSSIIPHSSSHLPSTHLRTYHPNTHPSISQPLFHPPSISPPTIHPFTLTAIHPPIHLSIHSLIQTFIHNAFIHPPVHPSLWHLFIKHSSFIHLSTFSFICSSAHASIYHPAIIYPSTNLPVYLSIDLWHSASILLSSSCPFGLYSSKHHLSIHLSIHLPIHTYIPNLCILPFNYLNLHVFIHLSSHSSTSLQSIRSTHHPYIYPPTHSPIYAYFYHPLIQAFISSSNHLNGHYPPPTLSFNLFCK